MCSQGISKFHREAIKYIKSIIPKRLKQLLSLLYKCIQSFKVYRLHTHNSLFPPARLIRVSNIDNFEVTGKDWTNKLIKIGGLKRNHFVLDVGCGSGRVAMFLTRKITKGRYFGFDLRQDEIEWLTGNITPKYPNFHFRHSNVYNAFYNKTGVILPSEYEFPYSENYFDFVFLTSVFTHMMPFDLWNYLREIKRVMKTQGRCFISYFLLNSGSRERIALGQSSRTFSNQIKSSCFSDNLETPEDAVAYEESYILSIYDKLGLKIIRPIHYDVWSKSKILNAARDYQDIIVAMKI